MQTPCWEMGSWPLESWDQYFCHLFLFEVVNMTLLFFKRNSYKIEPKIASFSELIFLHANLHIVQYMILFCKDSLKSMHLFMCAYKLHVQTHRLTDGRGRKEGLTDGQTDCPSDSYMPPSTLIAWNITMN